MPNFAIVALIGLLLLIPLIVFFLVILAALKSKRSVQKMTIPEPKKQERYGWEDYLKLPSEPQPKRISNKSFSVIVVIAIAILIIVLTYSYVIPAIPLNLSLNRTIEPAGMPIPEPDIPVEPSANLTLDLGLNLSSLGAGVASYKPYITAVVIAVAMLLVALVAFIFYVNRRKLSVINKAKKTADSLIKKAEIEVTVKKAAKKVKARQVKLGNPFRGLASKLRKVKKYLVALAVLAVVIVIAALIYLFREKVKNLFSGRVMDLLLQGKDFLNVYKFYILAGIVALVIIILLLRRSSK